MTNIIICYNIIIMSLTLVGSLNLTVVMIDHIIIKIKIDDKIRRVS